MHGLCMLASLLDEHCVSVSIESQSDILTAEVGRRADDNLSLVGLILGLGLSMQFALDPGSAIAEDLLGHHSESAKRVHGQRETGFCLRSVPLLRTESVSPVAFRGLPTKRPAVVRK